MPPPSSRSPPTLLDVLAAAPHALAAHLPPFALPGLLASVSNACGDTAATLLRETVRIALDGISFHDNHDELFVISLLRHVNAAAVTHLSISSVLEHDGAYAALALHSWSHLRVLHVDVTDEIVGNISAVVEACASTLEDIAFRDCRTVDNASVPVRRAALGLALACCSRLTRLAMPLQLLDIGPPGVAPLHEASRVARLEVHGVLPWFDGSDRETEIAARLVSCAATRGALTELELFGMFPRDRTVLAALGDAVVGAMPGVRTLSLSFTRVDGWNFPRMPLLTTLQWSALEDALTFAHVVRHAPALRVVVADGLHNHGGAAGAIDAALFARCGRCVQHAGACIEEITVDGAATLKVLASLSLGPALRSLSLVDGALGNRANLLLSADNSELLFSLPPSVDLLKATHMLRRHDLGVVLSSGPGPEVCAQLALPVAARAPWMACLRD